MCALVLLRLEGLVFLVSFIPTDYYTLCPFFPQSFLSPEERGVVVTSRLVLSVSIPLSLSAYCPAVGLCIRFCLLQENTALMVAVQDADLLVWQNVMRSHCIAMLL